MKGRPNHKVSEYITANNPMSVPETIAKMRATLAGRTLNLRGGNGRGSTVPQEMLHRELGFGWMVEYVVPTGQRVKGGPPSHYKIDLAHSGKKVAVELHGSSHRARKVRETDERKRLWLESRGWSVLSFSNEEVLANARAVAQSITSTH